MCTPSRNRAPAITLQSAVFIKRVQGNTSYSCRRTRLDFTTEFIIQSRSQTQVHTRSASLGCGVLSADTERTARCRRGSPSSRGLEGKVPFVNGALERSPSLAAPQFGGYLPKSLSERRQDITHCWGRERTRERGNESLGRPEWPGFVNGEVSLHTDKLWWRALSGQHWANLKVELLCTLTFQLSFVI